MFVRARIEEGVDENAMLVPQVGVTHDPKGRRPLSSSVLTTRWRSIRCSSEAQPATNGSSKAASMTAIV